MGYSRKLSPQHRQRISDGVRKAWARIPLADDSSICLNVNYDENNKDNFKVYTDDGTEINQ